MDAKLKIIKTFENLQSIEHGKIIYSLTEGQIYRWRKIEKFPQFHSLVQLVTDKEKIVSLDRQMFEQYNGVFIEQYETFIELIPLMMQQLNKKYNSDLEYLKKKLNHYD